MTKEAMEAETTTQHINDSKETQYMESNPVEGGGNEILVFVDTHDAEALGESKIAKDHHTILVPHPSDDPNDPLNWSWARKHGLLAAIALGSFQCDFTAGAIPAVILQGVEWNMDPNTVNKASSLSILMLGVGGLIWIPAGRFWGRAPVLFWTAVLGFVFTLLCAVAPNFDSFYAFRGLQATFQSSYLAIGLTVIVDVFFFHEHARKIGIWISFVLIGPYIGPILTNLMLYYLEEWRPVMWLITGVSGLNLILMPIFVDETFYDRSIPVESQPPRGSRIARIIGIWQLRNHGYFMPVVPSVVGFVKACVKPVVVLCFIYFMAAYMWFIGTGIAAPILLQTPPSYGGYGFTNKAVAYMYFAPLLGVLLGEGFGHFFNDWLAMRFIKRHKGRFVPEARLPATYVATIAMVPGLVLLGQGLGNHLHWTAIAFGWGMYTFGACVLAVALFAYVSDAYPQAAGECSALLNLARCLGGFAVGYFELPWGLRDGWAVTFGVKAAIVGISLLFVVTFQVFGSTMRRWGISLDR